MVGRAGSRQSSDHAEIPDRLKKEWEEPFGDRRQAIAFMGIDLDSADLSARLDACLLSESEMKSGEQQLGDAARSISGMVCQDARP